MAGHPADVGHAPVDIGLRLEVEDVPMGGRHPAQVAGGGVHDPLRLGGGARGVEQVEEVLGVHRLRFRRRRLVADRLVPPHVALVEPGHLLLRALHDHAVPDRGGPRDRLVRVALERHRGALPVAAVGGDHHAALRVVDAPGQGIGAEAAEDHRMRRADARAGQHGHGQLGNHRHVDGDPVALLHAHRAQRVRHAAGLFQQLGVGDRARVARLALPEVGDPVAQAVGHVTVEAVHADVQLAADEPLGVGRLPLEEVGPGLHPVEMLRLLGPELTEALVRLRPLVDGRIVQEGRGGERLARREGALLAEQVLDRLDVGASLFGGHAAGLCLLLRYGASILDRPRRCPISSRDARARGGGR